MINRLSALALALLFAIASFSVDASQNSLQMPTTGTVSGLQFSNDVTDALDSLATCNEGSTAPANAAGGSPKAGQCWLDNTSSTLKIKKVYTGSGWVVQGVLDVTNGIWLAPLGGGAGTVASASTTDLCATTNPQSLLTITGTTTITSFGSNCPAGVEKVLVFSSALTLTYDGTSLIIPGARSITTAAGDSARVISLGSGNYRVTSYTRADGSAVSNPAVPIGTILAYDGATAPTGYVLGYGQALSRADHPEYLAAVTRTQSATRTSGSLTITLDDTSGFGNGMPVEGTGIPSGAQIRWCNSSSCTLSAAATTSGTSNVTVFVTGYGSGGDSTTVGVKDCRGRSLAFRDNMGGTAANVLQVATTINTTSGSTSATVASASGLTVGMTVTAQNVVAGTKITSISGTTISLDQTALGTANNSPARFSLTGDAQALNAIGGAQTGSISVARLPTFTPSGSVASTPSVNSFLKSSASTRGRSDGDVTAQVPNADTNFSISSTFTGNPIGSNEPMPTLPPVVLADCIVRVSP